MTPTQAREIVRAAIDWVHAHDLRMAASRAKRQTGPFDRDSYRAREDLHELLGSELRPSVR